MLRQPAEDGVKMSVYFEDMDVCSLYAWSPLVIKQSEIVKLLKKLRYGSRKQKWFIKYRLKLNKGAWVHYDTVEKMDWTKKRISKMELLTDPTVNLEVSFDFEAFKRENKECMNKIFGPMGVTVPTINLNCPTATTQ